MTELVIAARDTIGCSVFETTDDSIYEENELVNITIHSTDSHVTVTPNTARVEIIDNDGTVSGHSSSIIMSIYTPTVVTVSWIQEMYIETEGSIFSICAQHHESTETAFNIGINFPDTEGGYRIKKVAIFDSYFLTTIYRYGNITIGFQLLTWRKFRFCMYRGNTFDR